MQRPPYGSWVEMTGLMPGRSEPFIGFVYLDSAAGPSAKGGFRGDPQMRDLPTITVRLGPQPMRLLTDQERAALQLPDQPSWLVHYGPQPARHALWLEDPRLAGRFHPDYPDDLEVVVHDGEPRRTGRRPELCWVRLEQVVGTLGKASIYRGRLLNQVNQLTTIRQGEMLNVLVSKGLKYPIRATDDYLAERKHWKLQPCDKCGADEMLDPPSVMARTRFPDLGPAEVMQAFSAFCSFCGGTQVLEALPPTN